MRANHTSTGQYSRRRDVLGGALSCLGIGLAVWSLGLSPMRPGSKAVNTQTPIVTPVPGWQIVASPNQSTTQDNELGGVTCVSASDCWAVGNYYTGTNYQTLIEHWDGIAWTMVASPNSSTTDTNLLHGVTCTSANDCWAVGKYKLPANVADQTLIEHWDGNSWSTTVSANTAPVLNNTLQDVTCISASDCWAIGSAADAISGVDQILTEHWDGNAWTVVSAPATGEWDYLTSIKCTSPGSCWAVGTGIDGGTGQTKSLVARWDGSSWALVDLPNPPPLPNTLSGLTCNSENDCWAAGTRDPGPGYGYATHIEHWDGNSWSVVPSPNTSPTRNNFLYSVTCASAVECWAIGMAYNGIAEQTLAEHWDGNEWSIAPSPDTSAGEYNRLWSVVCPSRITCFATGYYVNGSTHQTLIDRYLAGLTILSIARAPDGRVAVTGTAAPFSTVSLEITPDLATPFASTGSTTAADAAGTFQFQDENAGTFLQRFYRATYPNQ